MKFTQKGCVIKVAKSSKPTSNTKKVNKTKTTSKKTTTSKVKSSMEKFKMEAAHEVGVNLKSGYNGNLTAKQAGAIGGRMVKKMIDSYKNSHK